MLRRFFGGRATPFLLTLLLALLPSSLLAIELYPGWPVDIPNGSAVFSSPTAYDLDGDSSNGKEIIVATANGHLYAFYSDGSLYWEASTPNANCSNAGATNKVLSSPAVGELRGDGVPYVSIGYGGIGVVSCGGGLATFHGRTGEQVAVFDVQEDAPSERIHTIFSTPAFYDTDGNGSLEIGFGGFSRKAYLLNSTGKRLIFSAITADTVWSSAAFARFNNDTYASMVLGTDISENNALVPPTPNGGYLYKFKTVFFRSRARDCSLIKKKKKRRRCLKRQKQGNNKKQLSGSTQEFGFRDSDVVDWYTEFNQVVFSAPVIAELLPGQSGREIVTGSGCFFPQTSSDKRGKWIKILSNDGRVRRTYEAPGCNESSPTVADLDGDGDLEIVATFNAGGESHRLGYVVAWDPQTDQELWRTAPVNGGNDEYAAFKMSAISGDVNGDGADEVIVLNGGGAHILDGMTGEVLSCDSDVCRGGEARMRVGSTGRNTPALVDIDNDGDLELLVASGGKAYLFDDFTSLVSSTEGNNPPFQTLWPMWRGNPQRTGEVPK